MATEPRSINSSAPMIEATAGMITAYRVKPRSLRMVKGYRSVIPHGDILLFDPNRGRNLACCWLMQVFITIATEGSVIEYW
jgi:hypothetical protein